VLADRADDARRLRDVIDASGAKPVIPPNPTRKHPADHDRLRYRARNRIERVVSRLKRFRRIATRYDRRRLLPRRRPTRRQHRMADLNADLA
jgi:transposase